MKWVDRDGRLGRVLPRRLRVPGAHVERDHLDRVRAGFAELAKEPVRRLAVVALGPPHDLAADVVGHEREVVVLALPADLIDPDLKQVLETVRVQLIGADPADDPPNGVPVDSHQPGGFIWSSQHLDREELRWAREVGLRILRGCVRRGVCRLGGGSIGCVSGRRSREGSVAGRLVSRRACRRRLVSGGFGRVGGCRPLPRRRCRGVICRSLSGRRSRSCALGGVGCGGSLVSSGVRRRRSLVSCVGTS